MCDSDYYPLRMVSEEGAEHLEVRRASGSPASVSSSGRREEPEDEVLAFRSDLPVQA